MLRPYVHTALYKVSASALWRILEVARSDLMKERKPLEAAFYAALKNWNKEWIPVPYPDYEAFLEQEQFLSRTAWRLEQHVYWELN